MTSVTPAAGRRRIVVATVDTLTRQMAGPGIRAWHIALALSREHEVELVTTARCEVSHPDFRVREVDGRDLRQLEEWCDVFLFQGFLAHRYPFLLRSEKVLVVDIYDPLHLEQLEQSRDLEGAARHETVDTSVAVLNEQLVRGDFFLCASPKQRDFWLGQLAALGRLNPLTYDEDETLESLITVVPFGVAESPPERTRNGIKGVITGIGADDKVLLWGGGIYNWFDPLTLLRAVDKLRVRLPEVRLLFMGLRHPNPEVPEMRMGAATVELSRDLGLTGSHVFFNEGWIEYDDRQNFLLDADAGVSTHLDHVETAFSFRTRILDYLWAGLPIVATEGDAFAELITARGLGLTVPAGDVDALEAALHRVLTDRAFADDCRANIAAVVPDFLWSRALAPLVEFCRRPRRAPDLIDPDASRRLRSQLSVDPATQRSLGQDVAATVRVLRQEGIKEVAARAFHRLRRRLVQSGRWGGRWQ